MRHLRYVNYRMETTISDNIVLIFKLFKPIKEVIGSQFLENGSNYIMKNVKEVRVMQQSGNFRFDRKNKMLRFNGYLDVSKPRAKDNNGKLEIIKPAMAWITDVSFQTMSARARELTIKRNGEHILNLFGK